MLEIVFWLLMKFDVMSFWKHLKILSKQLTSQLPQWFTGIVDSAAGKYLGTNLTGAEREANAFTAQEAQKQRDFETEMSNTAFQRQVVDMQKAGINPALAMSPGSSGASTPSGASAQSVSPGSGADMIPMLFNYKLGRYRIDTDKELRNKELDIRQYDAETRRLAQESNNQRNQAYIRNLGAVTRGLEISNDVAEALKQIHIMQGEASLKLTNAQVELVNQSVEESSWRISKIIAEITTETFKAALLHTQERLFALDVKDKAIYLAYADKLYQNKADAAYYEAQDAALKYSYDQKVLTEESAKAVIDQLKAQSKISQNAQYSSDLTKDVILNKTRPDKYKNQFTKDEWKNLREGLTVAAYPSVSTGFSAGLMGFSDNFSVSYTPNPGQVVK